MSAKMGRGKTLDASIKTQSQQKIGVSEMSEAMEPQQQRQSTPRTRSNNLTVSTKEETHNPERLSSKLDNHSVASSTAPKRRGRPRRSASSSLSLDNHLGISLTSSLSNIDTETNRFRQSSFDMLQTPQDESNINVIEIVDDSDDTLPTYVASEEIVATEEKFVACPSVVESIPGDSQSEQFVINLSDDNSRTSLGHKPIVSIDESFVQQRIGDSQIKKNYVDVTESASQDNINTARDRRKYFAEPPQRVAEDLIANDFNNGNTSPMLSQDHSLNKMKVLRTYQNKRKSKYFSNPNESSNNTNITDPSIAIMDSSNDCIVEEISQPIESGKLLETVERRRSQRKKTMKYDVRDLFNKNKKCAIKITSPEVKPINKLLAINKVESSDDGSCSSNLSQLLDSPQVFKGFSDSESSKTSPILVAKKSDIQSMNDSEKELQSLLLEDSVVESRESNEILRAIDKLVLEKECGELLNDNVMLISVDTAKKVRTKASKKQFELDADDENKRTTRTTRKTRENGVVLDKSDNKIPDEVTIVRNENSVEKMQNKKLSTELLLKTEFKNIPGVKLRRLSTAAIMNSMHRPHQTTQSSSNPLEKLKSTGLNIKEPIENYMKTRIVDKPKIITVLGVGNTDIRDTKKIDERHDKFCSKIKLVNKEPCDVNGEEFKIETKKTPGDTVAVNNHHADGNIFNVSEKLQLKGTPYQIIHPLKKRKQIRNCILQKGFAAADIQLTDKQYKVELIKTVDSVESKDDEELKDVNKQAPSIEIPEEQSSANVNLLETEEIFICETSSFKIEKNEIEKAVDYKITDPTKTAEGRSEIENGSLLVDEPSTVEFVTNQPVSNKINDISLTTGDLKFVESKQAIEENESSKSHKKYEQKNHEIIEEANLLIKISEVIKEKCETILNNEETPVEQNCTTYNLLKPTEMIPSAETNIENPGTEIQSCVESSDISEEVILEVVTDKSNIALMPTKLENFVLSTDKHTENSTSKNKSKLVCDSEDILQKKSEELNSISYNDCKEKNNGKLFEKAVFTEKLLEVVKCQDKNSREILNDSKVLNEGDLEVSTEKKINVENEKGFSLGLKEISKDLEKLEFEANTSHNSKDIVKEVEKFTTLKLDNILKQSNEESLKNTRNYHFKRYSCETTDKHLDSKRENESEEKWSDNKTKCRDDHKKKRQNRSTKSNACKGETDKTSSKRSKKKDQLETKPDQLELETNCVPHTSKDMEIAGKSADQLAKTIFFNQAEFISAPNFESMPKGAPLAIVTDVETELSDKIENSEKILGGDYWEKSGNAVENLELGNLKQFEKLSEPLIKIKKKRRGKRKEEKSETKLKGKKTELQFNNTIEYSKINKKKLKRRIAKKSKLNKSVKKKNVETAQDNPLQEVPKIVDINEVSEEVSPESFSQQIASSVEADAVNTVSITQTLPARPRLVSRWDKTSPRRKENDLDSKALNNLEELTTIAVKVKESSKELAKIEMINFQDIQPAHMLKPAEKYDDIQTNILNKKEECNDERIDDSINDAVRRSHRIKTITRTKSQCVGRGLVKDRERFSIKDDDRSMSCGDNILDIIDFSDVNAVHHIDFNNAQYRLSQFVVIRENEYKCDRVISKEAKKMICDCFLTREEADRGELGCGEDCLNRLLMIECGPKCIVGDRCTNRRFQKTLYSPCRIFKTEKKGFGMMAESTILPGEFIMEYIGEVLNSQQFEKRADIYSQDKNRHYYFMALRSDAIIDATARGNISRFINHSCDPNAETQKWTVNGELRIGFFSKKKINAGEEITFDYQFQRYGKEAQKCFCESINCRGWIGEEPDSDFEEDDDEELSDSEDDLVSRNTDTNDSMLGDNSISKLTEKESIKITVPTMEEIEGMIQKSDESEISKAIQEILTTVKPPKLATIEAATRKLEIERLKPRKMKVKRDFQMRKKQIDFLEDADLEGEIEMLQRSGLKNQAQTLQLNRLMVRAKQLSSKISLLEILRKGEMPCRRLFLDYHGLRLLHGWMTETEGLNAEQDLTFRLLIAEVLETLPIPNKIMLKDSKVFSTIQYWSNVKPSDVSPNESPTDNLSATVTTLSTEDTCKPKTDSSTDTMQLISNPIQSEIKQLCLKLIITWDNLPEVFRIPKRERIEQMKEHEREADRQYKALNLADEEQDTDLSSQRNKERFGVGKISYKRYKWIRERAERERETRVKDKDPIEKSMADPSLTKVQRRELFAAQVAKDEAEKHLAEKRRVFDIKCKFYGLDPLKLNPNDMPFCVNPATGQWYTTDKRKIPTPPSHAHIQVPPKPKSTDPNDYRLPHMDLPPFWKFAIDSRGRIYYYHIKIRIPQWEPPIKILPLSTDEPRPGTSKEATSQSAAFDTDNSESDDDSNTEQNSTEYNSIDTKLNIEQLRESRKRERHNLLVQERTISPRREEDRLYNQIEMKRYKENKEKIRRRKEEIKRKKALLRFQQSSPTPAETETPQLLNSRSEPLPIQDYLISSDENDDDVLKSEFDSPVLNRFIQSDKIVDELDAIKKDKSLKRPLAFKDRSEYKKRLKQEGITEVNKTTKTSNERKSEQKMNSKYQARKAKEKFRSDIAGIIVQHLTPYRKESCKIGRIATNEDFKHLARKLTHFVMIKELRHCDSTGNALVVTESVKNKSREFIKKYMAKYGEVYVRPENDPEFRDVS